MDTKRGLIKTDTISIRLKAFVSKQSQDSFDGFGVAVRKRFPSITRRIPGMKTTVAMAGYSGDDPMAMPEKMKVGIVRVEPARL